jgi:hypothetical protein
MRTASRIREDYTGMDIDREGKEKKNNETQSICSEGVN